jgi:hypothetical protein
MNKNTLNGFINIFQWRKFGPLLAISAPSQQYENKLTDLVI